MEELSRADSRVTRYAPGTLPARLAGAEAGRWQVQPPTGLKGWMGKILKTSSVVASACAIGFAGCAVASHTVPSAVASQTVPSPRLDVGQIRGENGPTLERSLVIAIAMPLKWPGGWEFRPVSSSPGARYPYVVKIPFADAAGRMGLSPGKAKDVGLLSVSGATLIAETPKLHTNDGAIDLYVATYRSPSSARRGTEILVNEGRHAFPHATVLQGVPGGQFYRYAGCTFAHCGEFLFGVSNYVIQETSDCGGCGSQLLDTQASAIYIALRGQ